MKIAFTTEGTGLDSPLDMRFGRAKNFLVYDLEGDTFTVLENSQNLNAPQGAGIQSAQAVVKQGAAVLVTGHCGPKAFRVLSAAGVKIYNTDAATVSEALTLYKQGKLKEACDADVEGHWA